MIIQDIAGSGVASIPQTVVDDLAKNNRIKRAKYSKKSKKFEHLSSKPPQCNKDCNGDSEYASFTLKEVNNWLISLGIGEIKINTTNTLENYALKVTFGSHFDQDDIDDSTYDSISRNGIVKFPVHPLLRNDSQYDLPNELYLGQQTAILSIVDNTRSISEFKSILLAATANSNSLDVAKLCPPDCS
ncbi:MAG: hypothetical protein V4585_21125 [Bacteroidota bacterium]